MSGGVGHDVRSSVPDRARWTGGQDDIDVTAHVVGGGLVDRGDVDPAGPQHPGALADDGPHIGGPGGQVQQPHAADGVEFPVPEGQPPAVGEHDRTGQPGGGLPGHREGEVHPGHPHAVACGREPPGHYAGAAAEVKQAAGVRRYEAQYRFRGGGRPGLAAARGVVPLRFLVVVEHAVSVPRARGPGPPPCGRARSPSR